MKKSHALRRRVLALIAALFLVTVLAVPAFAAADSGNVFINGILVFSTDMDLSEYYVLNTHYTVDSGTVSVYDATGVLVENCTVFYIERNADQAIYVLTVATATSNARGVAVTSSDDFEGLYNANAGRYLVFNDVLVNRSSPIYQLCRNYAAVTSTLTYQNADDTSNNIVDVIVGGFNGVLTGFGSGTADFFETIFLNNDGTLTTFALVGLVFLGVGLSVGIARWVIKKVGH